jgi:phosphocarrier protein HPr
MLSRTAVIENRLGFHLAAVTIVVKATIGFKSNITMSKGGRKCNARSVLDLLLLEAVQGTKLTIEADGEDEAEAMEALLKLFETKFGEE